VRIEEFKPLYLHELLEAFPTFIERRISKVLPVEVDVVFDIGSHAEGEALPNADYDLSVLFHSREPGKIVLRKHCEEHEWFLGTEEDWYNNAKKRRGRGGSL
jgi:predicted nucleotidyltransferase